MPRLTAEPDEARLATARGSKRQDPQIPFLIHTVDARLIPNTRLTRKKKNYIPYLGKVSDDLATRQQFLQYGNRRRVVNSMAEADTFDVGTATADEIVAFALEEFGAALDVKTPLRTLRKQVMKLANMADTAGAPTEVAPAKPTGISAAIKNGVSVDDGDDLTS